MDIYELINSKAIQKHCREIQHKFNTEELAVLIYRNRTMDINEKIKAYQELIENYEDMEVIERINCKHHDSVKDMIREEIERIKHFEKVIKQDEQDAIYTYNYYYENNCTMEEARNELRDIYKTFKEAQEVISELVKKDTQNIINSYYITKRSVSRADKQRIIAEYIVSENRKLKMVHVYDVDSEAPDIGSICLNIPTPFKKRRFVSS